MQAYPQISEPKVDPRRPLNFGQFTFASDNWKFQKRSRKPGVADTPGTDLHTNKPKKGPGYGAHIYGIERSIDHLDCENSDCVRGSGF